MGVIVFGGSRCLWPLLANCEGFLQIQYEVKGGWPIVIIICINKQS